jgi:ergothioneine biosynthesis protein EgtB
MKPVRRNATEYLHEYRESAEELAEHYRAVRAFTEYLCEPLVTEDYVVQSMPDASPAKWHLAHTSWFFETFVLKAERPDYISAHPEYAYLFNSYYNAVGPMYPRAARGMISRPSVKEVYSYRGEIDRQMQELLQTGEERRRALEVIIILGIHHEQQHQELILTDLKHMFGRNPLHPVYRKREAVLATEVRPLSWLNFPDGLHWIGHDGEAFSFDNEGPRHQQFVQPFRLASRLVTNGEYLRFIGDNGYKRPEFWLSDGWIAVNEARWEAPLYWEKRDGRWLSFTLSGLRPVDESEPVCHISYYEADAFAQWAGARLPTEAEWEVAAANLSIDGNFVEAQRFHPMAAAQSSGTSGLHQMFGDVWEWTRSAYSPYPGYRALKGALGEYNGKFMANQYVLRGGSCATPLSHIRRTYRNFFAPEKRWQFSGIRLAKDNL